MKVLSSSGRFAGKLIILLALLVVGVMAIAPMTPAGGQQGMWGGPQAAQDEGGVCQKVDVNVITLSIAALTTGISLDSIVNATTGIVLSPFVNGLCSFYSGLVSWVKGQDFVFSTGDLITYNQPTVDKMHDALLPVAGAILALLFAIAGHRIILGASPLRVLPRVTLAGVLVFASEPLLRYTIEINNGLCSLVLGAAVQNRPGENLASLFLMGTNPLNFSSINWIGGAIILFMGIAVSLQDLVRIGIIDVLWVIAPLVLLGYGDPAWQRWANLWCCAWIATVFVQFLQLVVICLGAALVGNMGGIAPVAMLVGIAILWLAMKVPGWLSSAVANTLTGVPSVYQVIGNTVQRTVQLALTAAKLAV